MFLSVFMVIVQAHSVQADVVPGDLIDQSNYQKIEGLVPDYIVQWVKEGDLTMKIGELPYEPTDFIPPEFREKTNAGRYKVVENNALKDGKTGDLNPNPRNITGWPFPVIDTNDPTAPVQLLHNFNYKEYARFPLTVRDSWLVINRNGLEYNYKIRIQKMFYPENSKYEQGEISMFDAPFQVAGISNFSCNYMDSMKTGLRFVYAPELRKVKRLAYRLAGSEETLGTDFAPDDTWAGGPKTSFDEGSYKMLREQVALVPYLAGKPGRAVINEKGEIDSGFEKTGNGVRVGYENKDWKGAPWHITDVIWVKKPVYVFEGKSENRNYRYGPFECWWEKGTFTHVYKRVTDINGNLWKGIYYVHWVMESDDGKFCDIDFIGPIVVDVKSDRATTIVVSCKEGLSYTRNVSDVNDRLFTRSGFVKFTK